MFLYMMCDFKMFKNMCGDVKEKNMCDFKELN